MLEFEFKLETYYFGFNLHTFIKELQRVDSGEITVATLFNYNETFILEILHHPSRGDFLSIEYGSIFPDDPDLDEAEIRKSLLNNRLERPGSCFSVSFLRLTSPLSSLASFLTNIISSRAIDLHNPYS
jgi:hypothetical protein